MIRRFGLIATFLLTGCVGRYQTPVDTLVVGLGARPTTLDPRFATDANGARVGGLLFEGLVHAGPGFRPEGEAAESWVLRDHTYTFRLRPKLTFHNGRAVTPADVLASFAFFRGPKSPFASTLELIEDVAVTAEADRLVVAIRVKRVSDKFLLADLPAVKILPSPEMNERDFTRQLIGTGPFRLERQDLNEIRLASVRAQVPRLTFKIVRDDYTRFQKLLRGELDFAQAEIPADRVAEFETRPAQFHVYRYPGLTTTYVLINFRDPLLKKREVRAALARALRREDLIRFKMAGLARLADSILTPDNPYHFAATPRLDVAAGDLKGRKLTLKTSNNPQAIDNGKVIANQFGATGLEVELESYEWGKFYGDVRQGNFQLATMKWVGVVDPDIYRVAFHSREVPPGRNRGSYSNPDLDRLLDQTALVENTEKRRELFRQVQKMVHEDLAILPLWYDEQVAIASRKVTGFEPSLNSDFLPLARVRKQEHP